MRTILITLILGFYLQTSFGQSFINKADVRKENGSVGLWINNRQVPPFAYMSYLGESRYYDEVARHGLDLFCLPAYLGDLGINSMSGINPFRPTFWTGENQYDFKIIQKEFEKLISVKKDAKVIIRVHLDPPTWWLDQNPSERCALPDGKTLRVSYSSEKWRADAGKTLKALMDWLRQSDYNGNIIGIHIAGGSTEEWFYHYKDHFYDQSTARSSDFRKWLRVRYDNDLVRFRTAWGDQNITFETAEEADISGTLKGEALMEKNRNTQRLDSYDYHAQVIVGNIKYFSKIVKQESEGRLLTGAFYGYHLFVHDPRRGHGSLKELLMYPDLDYLSSPNDYRREVGLDWLPMAAIKSVQMHGKLWMAENDTRTALTKLLKEVAPEINPPGDWYSSPVWKGPQNMRISSELLWKNAARMLAYGYGGWWFDMWGGWYSDESFLSVFQSLNHLYAKKKSGKPQYQPEVVVVVDEKLQFYDETYGKITGSILSNRYPLGITGTSFDIVLRSDLDSLKTKNYKVVWYLGLHELSEKEKRTIGGLKVKTNFSIQTTEQGSEVFQKASSVALYDKKVVWNPEELRGIFKSAQVHIFGNHNDVVYAGNGWLAIHGRQAGKRTIQLPGKWKLTNVRTNQKLIADKRLLVDLEEGETILYQIN